MSDLPLADLAAVALGSNVGVSSQTIRDAIGQLHQYALSHFVASSLWHSTPVDCPPGSPDFTNAVVVFVPKPELTPELLLRGLQSLEASFGRVPKRVLNEPRPLDLDLLIFKQEIRANAWLTLPHPRAHQRGFVLGPLAEIAPDLVIPGQTRSVKELLGLLPPVPTLRRMGG